MSRRGASLIAVSGAVSLLSATFPSARITLVAGLIRDALLPRQVKGIVTARHLAIGGGNVAALLGDGTLRMWGHNGHGEIGTGSANNYEPRPVKNALTNVTAVYLGHALVRRACGRDVLDMGGSLRACVRHTRQHLESSDAVGTAVNSRYVPDADKGYLNGLASGIGLDRARRASRRSDRKRSKNPIPVAESPRYPAASRQATSTVCIR